MWRRMVNINMLDTISTCPTGLREVFNRSSGQRACGRTVIEGGCSSVKYRVGQTYTKVCGFARGYQFYTMDGFNWRPDGGLTLDEAYVDGLSITQGNPRKHLWTYVVGCNEGSSGRHKNSKCPRDEPSYNYQLIPTYIRNHYYCEAGFAVRSQRTAWEDPLWDGTGCSLTSHSCDRYGWFYRKIQPTNDFIELRWCADQAQSDEDFFVDVAEIWVL